MNRALRRLLGRYPHASRFARQKQLDIRLHAYHKLLHIIYRASACLNLRSSLPLVFEFGVRLLRCPNRCADVPS